MSERLRIILEFSKSKERELLLYQELIKYSNPVVTVKDMLLGVTPLPIVENIPREKWLVVLTVLMSTDKINKY